MIGDKQADDDKSQKAKLQDSRHGFGLTLLCFCILIFWIGGFGACSGMGMMGAKVVYPIISCITIVGMIVGVSLVFKNENSSNSIGYFKYLLSFITVSTILLFAITLLFIFGH